MVLQRHLEAAVLHLLQDGGTAAARFNKPAPLEEEYLFAVEGVCEVFRFPPAAMMSSYVLKPGELMCT